MTYDMGITTKFNQLPELENFHRGLSFAAYTFFGCHYIEELKVHRFLVWAPNAENVSLIGNFNGWDESANIMDKLPDGVFLSYVSGLNDGSIYKYAVMSKNGCIIHKADPFAFHCETGPKTASRVWNLAGFEWHRLGISQVKFKKKYIQLPNNNLRSTHRLLAQERGRGVSVVPQCCRFPCGLLQGYGLYSR